MHVIRGLANSSGTTHIVNPLAEAQGRLGAEVRVLHVEKPRAASIEPDRAWVTSRMFRLSAPMDNPGLSWRMARALPGEIAWCDVVHVHAIWNFPTWWAMRCARLGGKPYVVAPQGSFDPWAMRQNRWGKRIYGTLTELPLLKSASCMQALTEKELAQFRQGGLLGPAMIIPNGIPLADTQRQRCPGSLAQKLGLPAGSRTVMFLSRVHLKKGLDLLLGAFARLATFHPSVFLVVAGSDGGSGYLAEMKDLACTLGVDKRCCFVGEVSGDVKHSMLLGADAYGLISRSEGLPVAALEALGAGLPCVLSSECNLPEVAAANAGWIVEPSVEQTVTAFTELLSDPVGANERGSRGRALVAERFTWARIAEQTLELYGGLIHP